MLEREPAFWWREDSIWASLLSPLGAIYGAVAGARMQREGARASAPVICVGNLTLGGTGKTPAAIAIARLLESAGERPWFLSRGYRGRLQGPAQISSDMSAADAGDEPLLLARAAPTIVARDRAAGAALAHASGASVVVMDDGLQNPSLRKDVTLAVIDSRGIGNGRVFPAGPLRAPLDTQLAQVDAFIAVGARNAGFGKPVFAARLVPDEGAVASLRGRKVLAFAGIGNPEKFFATLDASGIEAVECRSFPDHHAFSAGEAAEILRTAERNKLLPLTTEKDLARMQGDPALAALRERAQALPVTIKFEDEAGLLRVLREKIAR